RRRCGRKSPCKESRPLPRQGPATSGYGSRPSPRWSLFRRSRTWRYGFVAEVGGPEVVERELRLDEPSKVASQGVEKAPYIESERIRCLDERNVADVEVHLQSTAGDRLLGRKMISQRDVPIAISADQQRGQSKSLELGDAVERSHRLG